MRLLLIFTLLFILMGGYITCFGGKPHGKYYQGVCTGQFNQDISDKRTWTIKDPHGDYDKNGACIK